MNLENEVTLDVETTTFAKGSPFSKYNRLCSVGILLGGDYRDFDIEYSNSPYGGHLEYIKDVVENATVLIGFNIKFDLNWIKRYVPSIVYPRIWDCQLAEFVLGGQLDPLPSLSECCERRGLGSKLDVVSSEFWDNGIDTPEIPWDILAEYQKQDIILTNQLYQLQRADFENGDPRLYNAFKMQCEDLLVLHESEYHGLLMNFAEADRLAEETLKEMNDIQEQLLIEGGDRRVNWGSSDHVSAILYGGEIDFKVRVPTRRVLKSGEVKEGEKWGLETVKFAGLTAPIKRSEGAATMGLSDDELRRINAEKVASGRKPLRRVYSTDEATLRSLKGSKKLKHIVDLCLRYSELKKLHGTYYTGLPKKSRDIGWEEGMLHGQFNMTIVPTSRLSSSDPNLQNLAGVTKPLFISRF